MSGQAEGESFYGYEPSHVVPAVFGSLTAISLILHIWQNVHYRFWRVMFFIVWAALVFSSGWFVRLASSYNHTIAEIGSTSTSLYISQTVLILAGPPIYSVAQYEVLSRLLHYIPYAAPLHPHRVYVFFTYLGALVESLTAAGGAIQVRDRDIDTRRRGETLLSIALVLQGVVQLGFLSVLYIAQSRARRIGPMPKNVSRIVIMLYGTSFLVIIRCIFRAIESFSQIPTEQSPTCSTSLCDFTGREWYLFVFEGAPMVLCSFWLNIMHPGRQLPRERLRYLDLDGKTERIGAGWIDKRSRWETFADPFDITGQMKGQPSHEKFWENPEQWPAIEDGSSFALGTASNVKGRSVKHGSTTMGDTEAMLK